MNDTQTIAAAAVSMQRRERAAIFMAGATLFIGFAYVLGVSGVPGDALVACLDWAVQQGWVQVDSPMAETSLALLQVQV
jgi:hypothetical protein